jgi:catechol 2,3-dioxygenase-like lactoylglutathione lyase family enzyme
VKIRGTDFVRFEVSDLAAAARFYRDVLGLAPHVYSEEYQWAEFDCGNVLILHHRADGTFGQNRPSTEMGAP